MLVMISCTPLHFADDMCWKWELWINIKKTQYLVVGSDKRELELPKGNDSRKATLPSVPFPVYCDYDGNTNWNSQILRKSCLWFLLGLKFYVFNCVKLEKKTLNIDLNTNWVFCMHVVELVISRQIFCLEIYVFSNV